MSVPSRSRAGNRRRVSSVRLLFRAAAFGVLWALLSGGRAWAIGIPAVLLATAAVPLAAPANRWSPAGAARFVPYFLWNSLRGAIDVAVRALKRGLPIDPAVVRYETRLDSPAARVLMANTVTLLPGTLSAELDGKVLRVHVLNAAGPVADMLNTLEERVAGFFPQAEPPERR